MYVPRTLNVRGGPVVWSGRSSAGTEPEPGTETGACGRWAQGVHRCCMVAPWLHRALTWHLALTGQPPHRHTVTVSAPP